MVAVDPDRYTNTTKQMDRVRTLYSDKYGT